MGKNGTSFCLSATLVLTAKRLQQPTVFWMLLTVSSQNHMVEHIWVEENAWVNYPIKTELVDMKGGDFSLDDDCDRFCVSWFPIIKVSAVGIALFVASWNEHPIPGKLSLNHTPRYLQNHGFSAADVPSLKRLQFDTIYMYLATKLYLKALILQI